MAKQGYLAFDLGAESGRLMLVSLADGKLEMEQLHRFPNGAQRLPSGLHWNVTGLWGHMLDGLAAAQRVGSERGIGFASLGVDTWGVDFGLLGRSGQLLGVPFSHRDERHPDAMRAACQKLGAKRLYDATGIQIMPINSLFQLYAQAQAEPSVLEAADRLLFTPDLLHYLFTGERVNEATIASTSQLVDPWKGTWATDLLRDLGVATGFLEGAEIVPAGTHVGELREAVAEAAGGLRVPVTTTACHDTASAVAAVPASSETSWAYLSSGTWSLMGAELAEPLVNDDARNAAFTNERGVGGRIRFLKNICGLWLVQECRRSFAQAGRDRDYGELTELAGQAPAFRTLLNPEHEPFLAPGRMPEKIQEHARATGQPVPEEPGELVRACLESLALMYRHTLVQLEALLGKRFDVLHVVGGGGQNELLNQLTADAIGRPVIVGPYEATSVGNALTQALGRGELASLDELRAVVRNTFEPIRYEPRNHAAASEQFDRFEQLLTGA